MCPETGKGDYGVVLTSYDEAKQESAAGALTKAFKFDVKVANTILKNAPMIVFEGLTEAVGKLVLEKMKELSDAGCELNLVPEPFETTKKLTWPKPHAFVRRAQEEAARPSEPVQITCPKCGEKFTFDPASPGETVPSVPQDAPLPEEPAKEIEELEGAPVEEVPASEAFPETSESSNGIMELDEFEASLEAMDLDGPPTDAGSEEDFDALDSAQAVEPATVEPDVVELDAVDEEKSAPEEPEKAPPELQKTVRYAKPKPKAAAPAASDGDGGQEVYRVILSKMRSDKMRTDAAEIIAQVQGISQEEALKMAGKLIVTAAKDVTEAKANEIKNTFTEKGIKAIVSKRK